MGDGWGGYETGGVGYEDDGEVGEGTGEGGGEREEELVDVLLTVTIKC